MLPPSRVFLRVKDSSYFLLLKDNGLFYAFKILYFNKKNKSCPHE